MQSFRLGAVLCAAGRSTRMGGTDKIEYQLGGKPVYAWAAEQLLAYPATVQLVIAVSAEKADAFATAFAQNPRVTICVGGASRQETVEKAVACLKNVDLIAIHDGARPFVRAELIDAVAKAAWEVGGAIPAMPVTDTIHVANDGMAQSTPDRATLYAAQTPQIFRTEILRDVLERVRNEGLLVTDDCSAVVACGYPCRMVEGDAENIKITAATDLARAEQIAATFSA